MKTILLNIRLLMAVLPVMVGCNAKQTADKLPDIDSSKIQLYHVVNGQNTLFPGGVHAMVLEYSKKDSITVYSPTEEHYLKVFTTAQGRFVVAFEQQNKVSAYRVDKVGPVKVFEDSLRGLLPQYVSIKDMNFDGADDMVIANNQGAHGNLYSYVLLYKDGAFVHDARFDLLNTELVPEQKQLRERYYSSACGAHSKSLYAVTGYNISLIKRVVIAPDCSPDAKYSKLFTTVLHNGKEITDSLTINHAKAWDMFKQAVWETKD